ncbi:hypothetical protein Emag_007350 [Eimeria magna]
MSMSCTALIFFILVYGRNLKDASASLADGAFASSPAIGGSGGDEGEDDTSSILNAAEQQLEVLSIPQAVSCLTSEDAVRIHQAQQRLLLEMAAIRRDKSRRRGFIEQAKKTSDERVREILQRDISRLHRVLEGRKHHLKLMGYVEPQRVRELVTMAEFWARANEISTAAAAAVVASWRVTQPSNHVSCDVKASERTTVKRFVKILINRGCVFSSKIQACPSPPADLVTSAREFLGTALEVVNLLEATKMKKEAQNLKEMCNSLSSDLGPSIAVQARLRSTFLTPSSKSRHSPHGKPDQTQGTASGIDGTLFLTPSLATYSPVASAPEESKPECITPEPVSTSHPELSALEKWTDEANQRLQLEDPLTMTSEKVASLETLWLEGNRLFAEVQKIRTEPGSDDDAFKTEVSKSCEYFLREVPLFLSSKWIQQLSESKRKLEERRKLFQEALMDISPDSAPPAESSVLQSITQLRTSIVEASDLVARLKPFHKTFPSSLPLLSMIAGELEETAFEADQELQSAGARVAKSWTIKLSATMPTAEPAPVTPLGDFGVSMQRDSVATQAASILQKLLKAGFRLAEIRQLEAAIKAAGVTGAS